MSVPMARSTSFSSSFLPLADNYIPFGSASSSSFSSAPYPSTNKGDVVSFPSRCKLACLFCRKRKVRCDGARGRCSNCSRSKRSCSYALVPEEDNKATKERKERLSALKSLGIVVPRGGAAVRATKDGTLQSFPPPPPSKEVKSRRETGKVGPFPSVLTLPGPMPVSEWISFDDLPPQAFSPPHPSPFFDVPDWSSSWTTSEASTSPGSYFPVDDDSFPHSLASQQMSRSTYSDSAYSACSQSSYGSFSASTSYPFHFDPTYDDSMPLTPTESVSSYYHSSIYSDPNPSYFPPFSFDATSPSHMTVSTHKPQPTPQVYQQGWGETPQPSQPSHLYTPSSFVYATPQQPTSTESSSRSAPHPFRRPMLQSTP